MERELLKALNNFLGAFSLYVAEVGCTKLTGMSLCTAQRELSIDISFVRL